MKFALLCQATSVIVNFVLRKVFVATLGEEYLGLNGLFSDILSMLSLAELGFGTSIIFSLYKPVAEENTEKIKSLMRLYRNIYTAVGLFVLIAGTSLAPRLDLFVKEMPDIAHIRLIYLLNVFNTAVSYFFVYKASLLFADQKKYVELIINTAVKTVCAVLQIAVLLTLRNYLVYLALMIFGTVVQNLLISHQTDKRYPYLKDKNIRPLEKEDKDTIRTNVGAMAFHKFGSVVIFSTDSILTAKLVSVAAVGLYSNYMLIRKAVLMVIETMFHGITSGMGNLNAAESNEKNTKPFVISFSFRRGCSGFAASALRNYITRLFRCGSAKSTCLTKAWCCSSSCIFTYTACAFRSPPAKRPWDFSSTTNTSRFPKRSSISFFRSFLQNAWALPESFSAR